MRLFIIEWAGDTTVYATSAETKEEAFNKFISYKGEEPISVETVEIQTFVSNEDNADVIFF